MPELIGWIVPGMLLVGLMACGGVGLMIWAETREKRSRAKKVPPFLLKCLGVILVSCVELTLTLGLSQHAMADEESVWLTSGMRSYHADREPAYNENNTGYGIEVRIDDAHALYIGHYRNSLYRLTEYVGYAWQPIEYGRLHIGFLNVIATGYLQGCNRAILAPLPMASYEWKYIGINVVVIPTIVTAVQLKVKIL